MQRDTQVTVDATPEPVNGARPSPSRAACSTPTGDRRVHRRRGGRPVQLQFRAEGCHDYTTVKTVRTTANGTVSTTVRASSDGSYRWVYAGTADTAAAVSAADFVDVR
ncbi:hypothetical protein E4K10_26030 [Streptomyces sp. T1317-0309]|nr:hypothetical protein E4K10_26030 [Streptomyces sp. T1317-0309]